MDWLDRCVYSFHILLTVKNKILTETLLHYGMFVMISGDLVNDEIDIALSSLTITSSREEVVDFITPYFDQSGISIVGRKPVRPRSLFKFLEVLHVEVHPVLYFNKTIFF